MSSSVGLEPAIPGLEVGCSTNLATESLLKVLFMFINMIFGRPARKGCFLYGKIIAYSQVSMDKAIYGQNGMGVLFPSGTLLDNHYLHLLLCLRAEHQCNFVGRLTKNQRFLTPVLWGHS